MTDKRKVLSGMTYQEFLNTTTDKDKLSTFLYNFCFAFYSESLSGICDTECYESKDKCYGCIKKLLDKEMDECRLLTRN